MSGKKNTRQLLADSLRELMRLHSFDRITVRDIVERCGVGRQTFYYYFQDKYDLMNWIYAEEAQPYAVMMSDKHDWAEGLTEMCRHIWRNREFYRNALRTTGPNSFPAFFREFIIEHTMSSIRDAANDRGTDPEKFRFLVDFCSIALVGMLTEWAEHGMKEDPVIFVEKMRSILDGSALAELYGKDGNTLK